MLSVRWHCAHWQKLKLSIWLTLQYLANRLRCIIARRLSTVMRSTAGLLRQSWSGTRMPLRSAKYAGCCSNCAGGTKRCMVWTQRPQE